MNINNLKKVFGISLIALTFVLAAAGISNAQYDRNRQDNNNQQDGRYRVRHGNYRTDQQGVNILQQAVNSGYQQGFQAGQEARGDRGLRNRRTNNSNNWRNNNVYRSGDMGYDNHVDRRQYQYYFQQGFQRGYDDGYNSRNRYGSNNTVLGTFLTQILGARRY